MARSAVPVQARDGPCHERGDGDPRKEGKKEMKYTTTILKKLYADGRIESTNEQMTLKQLQTFVGGRIEVVRSAVMYRALIVNEDGMLLHLPINEAATLLTMPGTLMDGGIRGDVLLIEERPEAG